MSLRKHICTVLQRWADETFYAEYASDRVYKNGYYHCHVAVREAGLIHYCMWSTKLYEQSSISLPAIFWLIFVYCMEIICEIVDRPVCRLR
jgi:hypothetical protein